MVLLEVVGLLILVTMVIVPVIVYIDAKIHSPHNPLLWGLVVFFGGIIGLLLYIVIGRTPTHNERLLGDTSE